MPTISNSDEQRLFGLRGKTVLTLTLLVLLALAMMGGVIYWQGSQLALANLLSQVQREIETDVVKIESSLAAIRKDLQVINTTPPPTAIFRSFDNGGIDPKSGSSLDQWKDRMQTIFSGFLQSHPEYLQIRLLSDTGMEIVRCEMRNGKIIIAEENELQDKGDHSYVASTIKLKPGHIYYSDVSLNRERGSVQFPTTPTLRMATPVYSEEGVARGLIIINVKAGKLFSSIIERKEDANDKYIFTEQEHILLHPDHSKEYGFDLGFAYSVSDVENHILNDLEGKEQLVQYHAGGGHIDGFRKIFFNPGNNDRWWAIYHHLPEDVGLNSLRITRNTMLLLGLGITLVSVLLIIWTVNHTIIRPVLILSTAARNMGGGKLDTRIDSSLLKDEFYDLSSFLNTFAESQDNAIEKFEKELSQRVATERAFSKVSSIFSRTFSRNDAIRDTAKVLAKTFDFPCIVYYSYDESGRKLHYMAGYGVPKKYKQTIDVDEGLIGQAITEKETLAVRSPEGIVCNIETGTCVLKPQTIFIQPIFFQESLKGTLVITSVKKTLSDNAFQSEKEFFGRLAIQLGIALQNLAQYADMQELSCKLEKRGSEIAEKNQQLRQANRLKSEFLANMSHELRTPLNAIIGFSELLKDGFLGDLTDNQSEHIKDIFTSGQHLLSLINDILDLSKIEAGKISLDRDNVDITQLLRNSLSIVRKRAQQHRVTLEVDLDESIGVISLDERKIKQVMYNLLSNAVKFTPEGGKVTIQSRKAVMPNNDPAFEISVSDTGIGIAPDDLDKLFRPFEQLDSSLARKYEGTGLGLALVEKLVTIHGGKISVTSELGKGSRFTALFPLSNDNMYEQEDQKITAVSSESTNANDYILIIGDNESSVKTMRLQLTNAGYSVEYSNSAEKGLNVAKDNRPAAIILDIILPDINGWEFLARLGDNEALKNVPVIIASVIADKAKGIAFGAADVLTKPVKKAELLQALAAAGVEASIDTTILVIDDDAVVRDSLCRSLTQNGYAVIEATGGEEGINKAQSSKPDAIILDLMMPEVNGFMVLDTLKTVRSTEKTPVIILTAKDISEEERSLLSKSALQIVAKSGDVESKLLESLRKTLSRRH